MEYLDLFDRDKLPLDKKILRGEKHEPGEYHYVVHILMFNSQGELLIQQRQDSKSLWPSLWDVSAGGTPVAGEKNWMGAQRELQEELGIDYDFSDIRPQITVSFDEGYSDYFIIHQNIDLDNIVKADREVKDVQFASLEDILSLQEKGEFVPYIKYFLQFLFTIGKTGTEIVQ